MKTLVARYKWAHQILRDETADLTLEQLDYVPAPGVNSLGVLIIHTLGSEVEVWSTLAGHECHRDRPSEFKTGGLNAISYFNRLDAADRLLDDLAPLVEAKVLAKVWHRPHREPHTGADWLINNYGHAREHIAHFQLTKQLIGDRYPPIVRPI